jgi:hypothetical protein
VLTPGGDVIREAIGAFPQVILAEGDYVLIARQEGQVYSRDFKVETGSIAISRFCAEVDAGAENALKGRAFSDWSLSDACADRSGIWRKTGQRAEAMPSGDPTRPSAMRIARQR